MELQDAIRSRVSIRKYQPRKVETEKIDTILRMGMCAPSASNRQPWKFWVVEDERLIEMLGASTPHAAPAAGAPLVIVVGNDAAISTGMGIVDCSAVIQNMLLAVTDLGLGGVWIGCWPHDDRQAAVRGILGIPEDIEIVSFIAVGYPAETPDPKNKWDPKKVKWM
jgi:nitroreductase